MGFPSLQARRPRVCAHKPLQVVVLVLVGVLPAFGNSEHLPQIKARPHAIFPIVRGGVLGRALQRRGQGILMCEGECYFGDRLQDHGTLRCKEASAPSPAADPDFMVWRRSRGVWQKLQWQVPLRPDLAFAVKDLARRPASLGKHGFMRPKRALNHVRSIIH